MFVDVEGTKSVRVMNKALKIAYLKYISVLISQKKVKGNANRLVWYFFAFMGRLKRLFTPRVTLGLRLVGEEREGEKAYVGLLCYK